MAPGRENDIVSALFTKTSVNDHEKLCGTAVLGLKESHYRHDDYERQLKRDEECWYEKGLVWKEGNLPLGNNKNGSLGKLNSLVINLKRDSEMHKTHDTVIQEQVQNKIQFQTTKTVSNNEISNYKEFYFPLNPSSKKKLNQQSYELFMTFGKI